jgi:hypothetical protein
LRTIQRAGPNPGDRWLADFLSQLQRDDLRPLLRGGLDLSLLGEQWDQLVRVAASLRDRVASAHVVLQRLANARRRIAWPRP